MELYAGGLAVLWAKDSEGISEVVNDLNGELTNFYYVLQREKLFERFALRVAVIPFGRSQWDKAVRRLREETQASRVAWAAWFYA